MGDNKKKDIKANEGSAISKQPQSQPARKQQSFRQSLIGKEGKAAGKTGFDNVNINNAVNALIYGDVINKYAKNDQDPNILQWLSARKKFSDSRIKVSEIKNITTAPILTEINNYDSSVSICLFIEGGQELILEFDDKKTRDLWWKGLLFMKEYGSELDVQKQECIQFYNRIKMNGKQYKQKFILKRALTKEQWISQMLLGTEVDKKKRMTDKEVKKLLRKLLIQIRSEELEEKMKKYYKNNEKTISYQDFIEVTINLIEKPEIQLIYQRYCSNNNMIQYKDIQTFYKEQQGEIYDEKQILVKMNKLSKGKEKKMMNYLSFCQLIFTNENSIYDPAKLNLQSNLDKPLSDYYINSSFRSYLVYDIATQMKDLTKAYIYLLQKGVRHLDIYCQDGESGMAEVAQGVFQVTTVSFEEIAKTIKQYGFERSVYPIILNIEHECSLVQQDRIAQVLINVFQDMLYKLPEDFISFQYLPSPNQLKKKVIIRTKGKLSNIISMYEKKVAKKVKEREEQQRLEMERKEREEKEKKQKMKDDEERKQRQQNDEEEEDYDNYDEDDSYSGKNKYNKKKNNNSKNNSGQKKPPVVQKKVTQKKTMSAQPTIKDNQLQKQPLTMGNLQMPEKRSNNEIEQLIDLEMNLDKEFINDDNYAIIKTNQINQFQIQQNKAIITANREIKSMVIQQQNSQYSLVENPKEAMQRKLRSDQYSFQEAKSPSLKSQQSNKQRRHTARSSSFKQIPHLEIPFKSDVPLFEYHGSQPNVNLVAKEDGFSMDSPVFMKHQNVNEKKRHSLLYLSRKRASMENLPVGNILNNMNPQLNESQKEIMANNSFYGENKRIQNGEEDDESDEFEEQNPEILSQILQLENLKSQGMGEDNQNTNHQQNHLYNNDCPSQRGETAGNIMQNSIYSPDGKIHQAKAKKLTKKNIVPISNLVEQCTALFACKYSSQADLSIWSFSQLSEQKVSSLTIQLMVGLSDENGFNLLNHTKQFLIRGYPKQMKSDHTNYNFIQIMAGGIQFPAMNFYTSDLYLLAYMAYFKQNGGCGYVPKPPWILSETPKTLNQYYEKDAQKPKIWLKIEIISAQSLRIPGDEEKKISPYVSIRLIGTAIDNQVNETVFTSNEVKDSSCYNPQFDNCIADFTIHIPELSFIIFQVYENPECADRFAQYAVPVSCIRKGFRTIPLLDTQMNPIPNSFLFAHVAIEVLTQQQQQQQQQIQLKPNSQHISPTSQIPVNKQQSATQNQQSIMDMPSL